MSIISNLLTNFEAQKVTKVTTPSMIPAFPEIIVFDTIEGKIAVYIRSIDGDDTENLVIQNEEGKTYTSAYTILKSAATIMKRLAALPRSELNQINSFDDIVKLVINSLARYDTKSFEVQDRVNKVLSK